MWVQPSQRDKLTRLSAVDAIGQVHAYMCAQMADLQYEHVIAIMHTILIVSCHLVTLHELPGAEYAHNVKMRLAQHIL